MKVNFKYGGKEDQSGVQKKRIHVNRNYDSYSSYRHTFNGFSAKSRGN